MPIKKLSASGISTFLKSPRSYYWRYIAGIEPLTQSVATYDHDKIAGQLWSQFVERFYKGQGEDDNTKRMIDDWEEQTQGWVPPAAFNRLRLAMEAWASHYYQTFSPDDGCRVQSEVLLENDRFLGYLDGLSADRIIHEVKSTSRSPQLSGQLWKVQQSIQVKLYCVLAKAKGIRIEFAFKDTPHGIFRSPVLEVTEEQLRGWEQELTALADVIHSLGTDVNNYPCHPDGCCLVTKGVTSMCSYQSLCELGLDDTTRIAYKDRERRK